MHGLDFNPWDMAVGVRHARPIAHTYPPGGGRGVTNHHPLKSK